MLEVNVLTIAAVYSLVQTVIGEDGDNRSSGLLKKEGFEAI